MSFFERTLSALFADVPELKDPKFIGNACIAQLTEHTVAKIQFIHLRVCNNYDALKVDVVNKTTGPVDTLVISFAEVLGSKPTRNASYPNGIVPHIYKDGKDTDWSMYRPTAQDYDVLRGAVATYLRAFI